MWRWLFRRRSIRSALLATVNTTMATMVTLLLAWHYVSEVDDAIAVSRASLGAEALAVHQGVFHQIKTHGRASAERFVSQIQSQADSESPRDHRIDVVFAANAIDSESNPASTDATLDERSADRVEPNYIVGRYKGNGLEVSVSEPTSEIHRAARHELLVQLGVLGLVGLVATVLVNIVLARIVNAPLHRLKEALKQIGGGNFDARIDPTGSTEMHQLARLVNGVCEQLSQAESHRRLQMQRARRIQRHLLPGDVRIPGLTGHTLFLPADEVGGDYYDFLPLPDGTWIICIADVTGHGVPAAMGAAMLKSLLQAAAERSAENPAGFLREINRHFARTAAPESFASMFLASWNPQTDNLTYASAGHEPALLLAGGDAIRWLSSTGLLLGIDASSEWKQRSIRLETGDRLLLFSDGATEAHGANGVLFGRDRLASLFSDSSQLSPDRAVDQLRCAIEEHTGEGRQSDDLTLIAFACGEFAESACVAQGDPGRAMNIRSGGDR